MDEEGRAVEHHLEVVRRARYWTIGDPDRDHDEAWFVLHGYGQLARRFLKRFDPLVSESRLIVAPEALSRFYVASAEGRHGRDALVGATWMTREDRELEIRDYVSYLDRLASKVLRGAPRVTVLGFSQGVATAWRWVTYGEVPGLTRLVAWAGDVPHDLDLGKAAEALRGVDVLLVSGAGDRTATPDAAAVGPTRLEGAGIAWRAVHHPGGHDIDEATLSAIAT